MRQRSISIIRKSLLATGWIGWGILIVLLTSDKFLMGLVALPFLVFLGIPFSIAAVWDIVRNFRSVWKLIAIVALGNAFLFLLPFIPWTQGTIPRYSTALIFALLLTWGGLSTGSYLLRERLPVLEAKKKNAQNGDKNVEAIDAG